MVNINGNLLSDDKAFISVDNRGFNYGDAVFETIRYTHGKLLFWEDHYFRLMSSMRIIRMEIPMSFTMEFLEEEILKTISSNHHLENSSVRVKLNIYRDSKGFYAPETNTIGFIITTKLLEDHFYLLKDSDYVVDLYKDHYILSGLLSNLKSHNRLINVMASIYAKDNNLNNCLLLNEQKQVVEASNGNIFLVFGSQIKTPPLESGCIKGVLRKQIIDIISQVKDLEINEDIVSPFELQKADEIFITNVISGVTTVTRYRKKKYKTDITKKLLAKLNTKIRFN